MWVDAALDSKLARRGRDYATFLVELFDSGVLELGDEGCMREESGAFVVCNKDGKQRVIFDTRNANMHFEQPPHVSLASAAAIGDMTVASGMPLHLGLGDVQCCFHQFELPIQCCGVFALLQLDARHFTQDERARLGIPIGAMQVWMWPCVVPMGWSWAVFLIHRVHEHVLRDVVPSDAWVLDKCGAQHVRSGRDVYALYIDNYACLNVSRERAEGEATRMKEALAAVGIVSDTEDVQVASDTFLGFELNVQAASWRPAPARFWKIVHALDFALTLGRCVTGAEVERLPGHVLATRLLKRELISTLGYMWKFIRDSYSRRQPLWPCVHAT